MHVCTYISSTVNPTKADNGIFFKSHEGTESTDAFDMVLKVQVYASRVLQTMLIVSNKACLTL